MTHRLMPKPERKIDDTKETLHQIFKSIADADSNQIPREHLQIFAHAIETQVGWNSNIISKKIELAFPNESQFNFELIWNGLISENLEEDPNLIKMTEGAFQKLNELKSIDIQSLSLSILKQKLKKHQLLIKPLLGDVRVPKISQTLFQISRAAKFGVADLTELRKSKGVCPPCWDRIQSLIAEFGKIPTDNRVIELYQLLEKLQTVSESESIFNRVSSSVFSIVDREKTGRIGFPEIREFIQTIWKHINLAELPSVEILTKLRQNSESYSLFQRTLSD